MQPSSEQLRRLYLRADAAPSMEAGSGEAAEPRARRGGLVRLPIARKEAQAEARPAVTGRALAFAKAVLREWFKQLRDLPGDLEMQRFLSLPPDILQALTDELITASDRHRIEERLIDVLRVLEDKRSTTRMGIVDQQVLLARNVIANFIDFLGVTAIPLDERPSSPIDGRKIFEAPPSIPRNTLPVLPVEEIPYAGMYVLDWLEAFRVLAIGNAGHSAGREITPEQNQRLGEILQVIRGAATATALA
jgi:hypothetical protein